MITPNASGGYQRRKCSKCGEGLGFTEGDPCDCCDEPQDGQRHEYSGCGNDDYCIEAAFGEPHCGQPREAEIHDTRIVFDTARTGPCSACGDGDTAQEYHSHGEPAPQQPEPALERIYTVGGKLTHGHFFAKRGGFVQTGYVREDIALASAEGEIRRQALEEAAGLASSRSSLEPDELADAIRALASSAPQADPKVNAIADAAYDNGFKAGRINALQDMGEATIPSAIEAIKAKRDEWQRTRSPEWGQAANELIELLKGKQNG